MLKLQILFPKANEDLIHSFIFELGISGFEELLPEFNQLKENLAGLNCYFPNQAQTETFKRQLVSMLESTAQTISLNFEECEVLDDWETEWQKYWKPTVAGNFYISPSWIKETPPHEKIPIYISSTTAFGTGAHETTKMCLEFLGEISSHKKINSFLDVGCGTGILSIAGAKLGIPNITGIDISEDAIVTSIKNAEENGVSASFSTTPLRELPQTFDLVVANIISSVLLELWRELTRKLHDNSSLILSGLLEEELPNFLNKIDKKPKRTKELGEWIALEF